MPRRGTQIPIICDDRGRSMTKMSIEFFHDVLCGWCFVMSPRLRRLVQDFPVEIKHRCFVLQDSRERMSEVFGSMPAAKEIILGHWVQCAAADDQPGRIDVEGMRAQPFEYPHGLPGALACKAAEILGGQAAHWDAFDRIQAAHLTENRNVGDEAVLEACAAAVGLDAAAFRAAVRRPETRAQVEADRRRARILGIRSIPSLVVGERVLPATSNEAALRRMVESLLDDPTLHRRAS
ncbi:DsbA family protein [Methylorubrum sp. SB2]|uniref:DsbA family oxidoreductase n=1 Tax=Methylorubrum subtropicum TaxID=3138812 RepID=UPI00313B1978